LKVKILTFAAVFAFAVLAIFANAQSNNPPSIAGLPDQTLMVGQSIPILDLFPYASDPEDPLTALAFSISSQSNLGVISCYINGNRYLACNPAQNTGFSDITVRVTDTGGLSSADTFRVAVQGQPPVNHVPAVNSVSITPSNPMDSDELTCQASVSDTDGNLDRVQFRWFVNGGLEKTRTLYVSGSSASASDALGSTVSDAGDSVRCETTVFDATGFQDSDSATVTIGNPSCGVDLFALQIEDNDRIRFSIRNTASGNENVNYKIYVDNAIIQNSQITLSPGETEVVHNDYDFGRGNFVVKAKATADCGSTDSETIVHNVLDDRRGRESPSIDSIRIKPDDPEEFDDLTCRVELSDDDGDLDRVRFRWLLEGNLERTRTVNLNGYSDTAQDTLDSWSFSRGDDVRCEATVFDREGNSDSDSETITRGEEHGCGVDAFNLRAIGNEIRFEVRNTGDDDQDIHYDIYVEDQRVRENTIFLDSGERKTIQETFYFGSGDDYYVKAKVTSDCGSTDWESVYHQPGGACKAKYLDEYKCEGPWRMRKYQNSDCSALWLNVESCLNGCYSGSCSGQYPPYGQCGVSLQRFDYQASVTANQAASIWLEAKNTGSASETITLSLLADGEVKGTYPASVAPGASSLRLFYYYPTLGTHQIVAKAETNCGSTDTRSASVTASQAQAPAPQPAPEQTYVSIYPSSVDASFCEAKFVNINVHNSRQQVFTIQVSGIPADWVSYQSQNIVEAGDRSLYVFVSPKELGFHQMKITVKAEGENLVYSQGVSVYTAPCQQEQPSPSGGGGITGLFEAAQSPWLWVVLIIILAGVVIFIGTRKLKPDIEYYEPAYPYAPARKKD
jgi:hypothetical protein